MSLFPLSFSYSFSDHRVLSNSTLLWKLLLRREVINCTNKLYTCKRRSLKYLFSNLSMLLNFPAGLVKVLKSTENAG
jgi:hypothetical protein